MTYDVPGDMLILIAFVFNLLAGVAFLLIARGKASFENLALNSYRVFSICVALAAAYLFYLFFSHNYAIKYVYEYSDRSLPFFYLLSSFWGGQEGTYLLWLLFNAAFGFLIIKFSGQYRNWAMVVFSTVNLFFLLILTNLSPFALLGFQAADGAGLNPLLQDPWMVIHPPIMFVGYSMAAVPFSIAMAALIMNDYSDWVRRTFPWAAVTTLALATGNILGAYWAYTTLGWGGYWAWDPVENSSLIPWFVSLALIHGLILEKRSGALRKTNMLLTAYVFILVVYGTFLTRSGVLADFSVHSFVDLGINQFLIGFLVFFTALALILFFPRVKAMGHVPLNYSLYSREFSIFAGMLLLFMFSVIVLFWTSLPILSGLFTDEPRAADLATYNSFGLPFAVLFALFLTATPFLTFNGDSLLDWRRKLMTAAVVAAVLGFGVFYLLLDADLVFAVVFTLMVTGLSMYLIKPDLGKSLIPALAAGLVTIVICLVVGVADYMYIMFFASAAMFTVSGVISVIRFLPSQWNHVGGPLAHFGFGLMLIGVLASSGFSTNQRLVIPRGETGEVFGLTVGYEGMEHDIEYPKNRLIVSYSDGGEHEHAFPELYFSERMGGVMRKPFVKNDLLQDVYFSPEQVQELGASGGLELKKGEPRTVGEYTFTFSDYAMDGGHQSDSTMTVIARVSLEHNGNTTELQPAIKVVSTEERNITSEIPAEFGEGGQYSMTIDQILADQGAVAVNVPGLVEAGPPDRLIIDISRKPLIILVWVGTIFIMLGSLILFVRRRSEMVA